MSDFFLQVLHKLATAKIDNPRLEARLMFAQVLGCRPSEVYQGISLNECERKSVEVMLSERLQHKPLDKILGHREFYKYDFAVNENVLSPRPDTEILVEVALAALQNIKQPKILDLGCGSGCIIETLLKELPLACGCAVDISENALATAKKNAERLQVASRLVFVKADWFAADCADKVNDKFDMIVSNPPYIPTKEILLLDPEVRCYDPHIALDGGDDGYASYRQIAKISSSLLYDNGHIILEVGQGQAEQVVGIFAEHGFRDSNIVKDLAGINRCVIMQKAVAESKKS